MRQSPRRPLILKRRKLPFQESQAAAPQPQPASTDPPAAPRGLPSGLRVLDHPYMSDTQLVVVPKTADLQSVIGALTNKGKECGMAGPNKFILLSGNDHDNQSTAGQEAETPKNKSVGLSKQLSGGPLDDSLTNMQWLGTMDSMDLPGESAESQKENLNPQVNSSVGEGPGAGSAPPREERPPYSYMVIIQFAINSGNGRRMTLKEIYTWIEDRFPYYRDVAKPGWKNSIRHNLSLHDMFTRETSPDGKVSFWTIRPEANRCLTLDQPDLDPMSAPLPVPMLLFPHQQKRILPEPKRTPTGCERRIKPLLPRTDSYLVPVQIPVATPIYLTPASVSASVFASCPEVKPRSAKRVRIAPKVTVAAPSPLKVKEEPVCVPLACETPKAAPRRPTSSSRRKQHLVRSLHEEPLLLYPDTFLDSGLASDASTFHEGHDAEPDAPRHDSPDRDFSFKTPVKSCCHLTTSTPSKPPEQWRVTPVGNGSHAVLDFSPVRTPLRDFTSSTPFKELPLFSSPRELLSHAEGSQQSCSRELLQHATPTTNRSMTEGLVLDTLNDSLSKILVDLSFTGLEDEDLGMANISWSEFFPQWK